MGPQFFQTRIGQQFYESTMPRIATALERLANAFDTHNAAQKKEHDERQVREASEPVQVPARGKNSEEA